MNIYIKCQNIEIILVVFVIHDTLLISQQNKTEKIMGILDKLLELRKEKLKRDIKVTKIFAKDSDLLLILDFCKMCGILRNEDTLATMLAQHTKILGLLVQRSEEDITFLA